MPMRSKAQRRWMWANDPEMAARWEKETPNGKRLPEKIKEAFVKGSADALYAFGFKSAAKECRLKIPKRKDGKFHGIDGAFRTEHRKNAELAPSLPPLPADEIPGGLLPPGPPSIEEPVPGTEGVLGEEEITGDAPVDQLTKILQALPAPVPAENDARQDPLDRDTMWGGRTDLSGGDAGGRVNNLGQNTDVGTAF